MDRQKSFEALMELKGCDEGKEMVKRLETVLRNRENLTLSDITPPNYLLVTQKGGGVTTFINKFTDYLNAANIIKFCGRIKFFEFKMKYCSPSEPFTELMRLQSTISKAAGYNRYYNGVVCIDVEDWVESAHDEYFIRLLNFVGNNKDKWLTIFCIHTTSKSVVEAMEIALAPHMRFETIRLRFPSSPELVDWVGSQLLSSNSFVLDDEAKTLLCETFDELSKAKTFRGFKSIEQLANEILFSILTKELGNKRRITAKMLFEYGKESAYVKRNKAQINLRKHIGFTNAEVLAK